LGTLSDTARAKKFFLEHLIADPSFSLGIVARFKGHFPTCPGRFCIARSFRSSKKMPAPQSAIRRRRWRVHTEWRTKSAYRRSPSLRLSCRQRKEGTHRVRPAVEHDHFTS